MVAGGVGLAPFATLAEALAARRTSMTLFYGARTAADLYYADLLRRARRHASSSRPRTAAAASAAASRAPLERALNERGAADRRHDLRLRADADDARGRPARRTRAGRPVVRLARTGDGLRHGRLLQLRRPGPAAARGSHFVRSCLEGPVFDATAVVWDALCSVGH